MTEPAEFEDSAPLEPQPADPYDGVALGVECAWPVSQAMLQPD